MPVTRDTRSTWTDIPRSDLPEWNRSLLSHTDTHLQQYPFYNERFRGPLLSLRYLCYGPRAAPVAYACVFTVGLPGLRVGLIVNGPASLVPDGNVSADMMKSFAGWARRNGYIFVRVTHPDATFLERLSILGSVETGDPFQTYFAPTSELVVPLVEDEAKMLSGFQEVARRLIRQAGRADYTLEATESAEALEKVWPLFAEHTRRKRLSSLPLDKYQSLMRLAQPGRCARLYIASIAGRPVNAILILRDRNVAHYHIGASDVGALDGRPSPSCLLHFQAMRYAYQQGATVYNLGIRGGPVYTFKKKFRPSEIFYPEPRVIVLRPLLYRLWKLSVFKYLPTLVAMLRALQGRT